MQLLALESMVIVYSRFLQAELLLGQHMLTTFNVQYLAQSFSPLFIKYALLVPQLLYFSYTTNSIPKISFIAVE